MTQKTVSDMWGRLLDLLVGPMVVVGPASDRRLGRLIATMALALVAAQMVPVVLWIISPMEYVAAVEIATLSVCLPATLLVYLLARRGAPRVAAWILIVGTTLAVFVLTFAGLAGLNPLYGATDAGALAFLVLPVFVAASVLSRRAAIVVAVLAVAAMLTVPPLAPVVGWGELLGGPIALVVLFALLVIIFAGYRERLEQERTAQLVEEIDERRQAQTELAHYLDELESLVHERTKDLETANDRLVEANQAKTRFLANVTHELRTPMNSIIGFTGTMLQGLPGPLTEEQTRQLGMVDGSAHHLLELINQLLDLARIESGSETLRPSTFLLGELLDEVRDLVEPLASAKNLGVLVDHLSSAAGPLTVTTDRDKLRQILLNLLGNAIKFTEAGEVTLAAELHDESVAVAVVDTGIGMPPETLESIFEEYHQVHTPGRAKPEGTGLGLALSRRLARLLGGDIAVTSQVGVGSRFTVTFPRQLAGDGSCG